MSLANKTGRVYRNTLCDFVEECGLQTSDGSSSEGIDGVPVSPDFTIGRVSVFVKTQTGPGTAEDKVPYVALNAEASVGRKGSAVIVLCGKGWTLAKKQFFTGKMTRKLGLRRVRVMSEADFRREVVRGEVAPARMQDLA